jgi:hypothetical protein
MLIHIVCIVVTSRDATAEHHKQPVTNMRQAYRLQFKLKDRTTANRICSLSLGEVQRAMHCGRVMAVGIITDSVGRNMRMKLIRRER